MIYNFHRKENMSKIVWFGSNITQADEVLLQITHCLSFNNRHPRIPIGNKATAKQSPAGG